VSKARIAQPAKRGVGSRHRRLAFGAKRRQEVHHDSRRIAGEGVFVLWPYQIGGDAEHKRRLLYNALTRAERWCTIVAQNADLLQAAPFR
jgi:hypothetical protein